MKHIFLAIIVVVLIFPLGASATNAPASFSAANSLVAASSSPGNAYTAGASVVVTAPTTGDLTAVGGSVVAAGSVGGDELLVGGSVSSRAPVKGDLRTLGGTVNIMEAIAGDLVAFGYRVDSVGRAGGSVFIMAANATLSNGAGGPVTIYSNNVLLAGDFASDVTVVAGGVVTLGKDTVIRGKLSYEAPDTARIPASATIIGGIEYTNASYLPDMGTSRALALASIGIFLLVRVIGALILAGLMAGLFPRLARAVTDRMYTRRVRSVLLTALFGFSVVVAMPVLFIMLALTFVGFGVAVLLMILYALLVVLAVLYAGILLGTMFVRYFAERETILWHDGVLGMLAFSLIALVPIFGWIIAIFLASFSAGALLILFFQFAFAQDEQTPELL